MLRRTPWGLPTGPGSAALAAVRDGLVSRPGLFGLLGGAGRVSEVSAPAGSGKTLLLRSWISETGLTDHAAWVPVQREEHDPQRFWLTVLGALRETVRRVKAGAVGDGGPRSGRLDGRRAAAGRSRRPRGPGLAGDRRRARAQLRRGAAPAGAADDARARGAAVRARQPP